MSIANFEISRHLPILSLSPSLSLPPALPLAAGYCSWPNDDDDHCWLFRFQPSCVFLASAVSLACSATVRTGSSGFILLNRAQDSAEIAINMELAYACNLNNRFELFLDEENDPLDLLAKQEQAHRKAGVSILPKRRSERRFIVKFLPAAAATT